MTQAKRVTRLDHVDHGGTNSVATTRCRGGVDMLLSMLLVVLSSFC